VGTGKGLGWGIGEGYYPGTKERPLYAYGTPVAPTAPAVAGADGSHTNVPTRDEGR
jgi:hypothetical protein